MKILIYIIKNIFDYTILSLVVFLFTKYCFALAIIPNDIKDYKKGDIVLIDKISIVQSGDNVLIVNDEGVKALLSDKEKKEHVYGKVIFKIWPIF